MNWEAVGAISEAVGVIAIFISLIYVAIQIRQNTLQSARSVEATQLAALENNIESGNRMRELLLTNPELLLLLGRGYAGLDKLNPLEQTQFGLILRNIFSSLQGNVVRYRMVGHHEDAIEGSIKLMDGFLKKRGVREWLAVTNPDWRKEFRELVDSRLAVIEDRIKSDEAQAAQTSE